MAFRIGAVCAAAVGMSRSLVGAVMNDSSDSTQLASDMWSELSAATVRSMPSEAIVCGIDDLGDAASNKAHCIALRRVGSSFDKGDPVLVSAKAATSLSVDSLSENVAIVCTLSEEGNGTCMLLNHAEGGLSLAVNPSINVGTTEAAAIWTDSGVGMEVARLSESTAVVCYELELAPTSKEVRCTVLSRQDVTLVEQGTSLLVASNYNSVELQIEGLADNLVQLCIWIFANGQQEQQGECVTLSVADGVLEKSEANVFHTGFLGQMALSKISETTAVVCYSEYASASPQTDCSVVAHNNGTATIRARGAGDNFTSTIPTSIAGACEHVALVCAATTEEIACRSLNVSAGGVEVMGSERLHYGAIKAIASVGLDLDSSLVCYTRNEEADTVCHIHFVEACPSSTTTGTSTSTAHSTTMPVMPMICGVEPARLEICDDFDVRLVDAFNATGTPQVYIGGQFYNICAHMFVDTQFGAEIFCSRLGYPTGTVQYTGGYSQQESALIPGCGPNDTSLEDCSNVWNVSGAEGTFAGRLGFSLVWRDLRYACTSGDAPEITVSCLGCPWDEAKIMRYCEPPDWSAVEQEDRDNMSFNGTANGADHEMSGPSLLSLIYLFHAILPMLGHPKGAA